MSEALQAVLRASLEQGRRARDAGDAVGARRALEQARLLAPDDAGIALELALACLASGDAPQAAAHAAMAAERQVGWRAELVLAEAVRQLQRPDDAAAHLQRSLDDTALPPPRRAAVWRQLADLRINAFGDARGAAAALHAGAQAEPALALEADLAALVADLYEGTRPGAALAAGFSALGSRLSMPATRQHVPRTVTGRRLRIGLLSAQFCASPVGFLTLGTLTALARDADLIFFDRGAKDDWARAAFQDLAHRWVACRNLDSTTLHALMHVADLDTLIDLGGWTDPDALAAVAARPARRQLKWVGGQSLSTGLRCFDGFIADARQVPPAAAALYTEPVLRARHGYVTYTAPPYAHALVQATARLPRPHGRPAPGVFALVSNPAKISAATAQLLQRLKPRRLLLVDQRWRHEGTRRAAMQRLGRLLDVAEFMVPAGGHPGYLATLKALDATFVDTAPYAMGLTAIELRLLGKHLYAGPRSPTALMCERHAVAHLGARRFDHHAELAAQLLQWCRA